MRKIAINWSPPPPPKLWTLVPKLRSRKLRLQRNRKTTFVFLLRLATFLSLCWSDFSPPQIPTDYPPLLAYLPPFPTGSKSPPIDYNSSPIKLSYNWMDLPSPEATIFPATTSRDNQQQEVATGGNNNINNHNFSSGAYRRSCPPSGAVARQQQQQQHRSVMRSIKLQKSMTFLYPFLRDILYMLVLSLTYFVVAPINF